MGVYSHDMRMYIRTYIHVSGMLRVSCRPIEFVSAESARCEIYNLETQISGQARSSYIWSRRRTSGLAELEQLHVKSNSERTQHLLSAPHSQTREL